jgi:hypothetical protein
VPVSSKEIKSKAGVRTKKDILSTKIKTLDGAAVQLGVDDQSGEKRRRGKELKGKSSHEKNGEKGTRSRGGFTRGGFIGVLQVNERL